MAAHRAIKISFPKPLGWSKSKRLIRLALFSFFGSGVDHWWTALRTSLQRIGLPVGIETHMLDGLTLLLNPRVVAPLLEEHST